MPGPSKPDEFEEFLSAPLEQLVAALARGVAQAQDEMDLETIERVKKIYSEDDGSYAELRKLGYQPTWYRIPEATAEVSVSFSISEADQTDLGVGIKLHGATMNATYSNSYGFKAEAASKLTFRVVPVPPAPQLEDMKVVPSGLTQKTYGEVRALLSGLGIEHEPADPNWQPREGDQVTGTDPEDGEILLQAQRLKLTLKRPPAAKKKPPPKEPQPEQPQPEDPPD